MTWRASRAAAPLARISAAQRDVRSARHELGYARNLTLTQGVDGSGEVIMRDDGRTLEGVNIANFEETCVESNAGSDALRLGNYEGVPQRSGTHARYDGGIGVLASVSKNGATRQQRHVADGVAPRNEQLKVRAANHTVQPVARGWTVPLREKESHAPNREAIRAREQVPHSVTDGG